MATLLLRVEVYMLEGESGVYRVGGGDAIMIKTSPSPQNS